ncbi:MAG: M23 family metallopeptidase [Lachnospiraceae bacterium]|nr:M23 family metallopeptidase [Lachnospiraceae bacterium]
MSYFTKYHRRIKVTNLKTAALILIIALFLLPSFTPASNGEETVFEIMLNGDSVGRLRSPEPAGRLLGEVRRELAQGQEDPFFVDADLFIEGRKDMFAHFTDESEMKEQMKAILLRDQTVTDHPAYSVKVGQTMVSVRDLSSVTDMMQKTVDTYQTGKEFVVELSSDTDRQINVLTAQTVQSDVADELKKTVLAAGSGLETDTSKVQDMAVGEGFEAFDYGLKNLYFANKVEVAEAYLSEDQLTDPATGADILTHPAQEQKIYEVQAGDTLSEIAINTETPLETLIALNESLEDENSTIRDGQELIITSPVPPLSIGREEELYYEENYEAEIEYIYNDNWYTNEKEVRQAPSAGHRKVAAKKVFWNDKEMETEILMEEVTYPAVAKVVEVGTKVPPTYIRPIYGGRLSSGFGRRKAPKKGASTYHKGVDLATPVGTAVMASCGGVVEKAGWGSGYGYVVYINHADGRQTRYGHLSKVLVKPGEKVSQGQKIALSGNTGRSTGPHLHFEMRIGGNPVNPLEYLN